MSQDNENQSGSERDSKGRFTKGNKGGPGNPYARKSATLRKVFSDAISEQDMVNLAKSLLMRAIDGDMAAAKLVLSYGIGTPEPVRDPDRVDMDEMRLFQEGVDETKRMASALILPQPEVCCEMTRAIQETIKEEYKANLLKSLVEYEAKLEEDAQAAEVERILEGGELTEEEEEEAPIANGDLRTAGKGEEPATPIANGDLRTAEVESGNLTAKAQRRKEDISGGEAEHQSRSDLGGEPMTNGRNGQNGDGTGRRQGVAVHGCCVNGWED